MGTSQVWWEHLLFLLLAPSKDAVAQLMDEIWVHRRRGLTPPQRARIKEQFRIASDDQLNLLLESILHLIRKSVYASLNEEAILGLLPVDFHSQLRKLLAQIILKFQVEWRKEAMNSQVSLPQLHAMRWDVLDDPHLSTETGTGKSTGAIISLTVQDDINETGNEREIQFKISRESLGAMIESLNIVQAQFASISKAAT